jgi:hypothetical protein
MLPYRLLLLTGLAATLERHAQIYFDVYPDLRPERQVRRCPNLRGPTPERGRDLGPLRLHRQVLRHELPHPADDPALTQNCLGFLGRGDTCTYPDLQAERGPRWVPVEGLNDEERGPDARLVEGGVRPEREATVLGKLGVSSRTAAATQAARLGLL